MKNTGTVYFYDAGGAIGSGFYILKNAVRTDTWRIDVWDSGGVFHSTNGEDLWQLGN